MHLEKNKQKKKNTSLSPSLQESTVCLKSNCSVPKRVDIQQLNHSGGVVDCWGWGLRAQQHTSGSQVRSSWILCCEMVKLNSRPHGVSWPQGASRGGRRVAGGRGLDVVKISNTQPFPPSILVYHKSICFFNFYLTFIPTLSRTFAAYCAFYKSPSF